MLDAEYYQIRSVHHGPVSGLVGIFVVTPGSSFAHFDFIVIIPERFFVVPELCGEIGQYPDMCAVIAPVLPLAAAYGRGNNLIKLSVPAYEEFYLFIFLQ